MLYKKDKRFKNTQHRVMYEGVSGTHFSIKWFSLKKTADGLFIVENSTGKIADVFAK
jgi:hypothetical protein